MTGRPRRPPRAPARAKAPRQALRRSVKRRGSLSRRRTGVWLRRHPAGLVATLAVLVLGLWLVWLTRGPWRDGRPADVTLPQGASVTSIAGALARSRVIRSPPLFLLAAELSGAASRLKAGEYVFAPGASLVRVIAAVAEGKVVRRRVIVPEGVTSAWVARQIDANSALSGAVSPPAEGTLLPGAYDYHLGEARQTVLERMAAAQRALLARLWPARDPGLPYRAAEDAVTLASIVEKETALPAERPLIAGLFINRLRAGIRLESDPTVIYGLTGGAPLGHGLRVSELASASAYNTYRRAGLPPGPIANPGEAALFAVLHPARTASLYFVANGTGGHSFAATWAEHLANVARWREVEAARGQAAAGTLAAGR